MFLKKYEYERYSGASQPNEALKHLVHQLFPLLTGEDLDYAAEVIRDVAREEVDQHEERKSHEFRDHSDE